MWGRENGKSESVKCRFSSFHVHVIYLGILSQYSFQFGRSVVKPDKLHLWKAPHSCWGCRSTGHGLLHTTLDPLRWCIVSSKECWLSSPLLFHVLQPYPWARLHELTKGCILPATSAPGATITEFWTFLLPFPALSFPPSSPSAVHCDGC